MLSIIWSLLPIPLGIFCLFYGLLSDRRTQNSDEDKTKKTETPETTGKITINDIDNYQFDDPNETQLDDEAILYYRILMVGLGTGSIILGFELLFPPLAIVAKLVFFLTLVLAITIHLAKEKKKKAAFEEYMQQQQEKSAASTKTEKK